MPSQNDLTIEERVQRLEKLLDTILMLARHHPVVAKFIDLLGL